MLPAITLDVEPTPPGLQRLSAQLTAFASEHDLPDSAARRLVGVAGEMADVLVSSLDAPPVRRLWADADIGREDAQLVLIASDQRLLDRYGTLRGRLAAIASRCDGFATHVSAGVEVQVWASFRLGTAPAQR